MITRDAIIKQLVEVVEAVRAAKDAGVACLLPDVVIFEDEGAYFEVPLVDQRDMEEALLVKKVAQESFSFPFKPN